MTTQTHDQRSTAASWHEVGPAMTAADASSELVERGFDREQAQAMVAGYLDATSREVGVSVHRWGLDDDDLDRIVTRHHDPAQLDDTDLDADWDADADRDGGAW